MSPLKKYRIVYLLNRRGLVIASQQECETLAHTAEEAVDRFKQTKPAGYEYHVQYWEEVK